MRQHPESLQKGTLSKVLPENTLTQHYFWKKGHFFVKYYCEGQRLTTDADFFWIIPWKVYQKSWSYAIYTVPEIWHTTDVIVIFHFGLIFALLPPKQTKRKIQKNEKNNGKYGVWDGVWQMQLLFFKLDYFLPLLTA